MGAVGAVGAVESDGVGRLPKTSRGPLVPGESHGKCGVRTAIDPVRAPRFHVSVLAKERAKGCVDSDDRVPWVAGMAHGHGGHGDLSELTLTKGPPHFGAQKMGKDLRGKG